MSHKWRYYEKIYTDYRITFCCPQSPGSVICSAYNILANRLILAGGHAGEATEVF
jgi:hypothetical protein